jgi:hypothetical protein
MVLHVENVSAASACGGGNMRTVNAGRTLVGRHLPATITLMLVVALLWRPTVGAQVAATGGWNTLPYQMPINPIHAALVNNGKVLIVSGSGNVATNTDFEAAVWDWQSGTITKQPVAWDMFCNGMVVLPDGRPFINSGTLAYDPFKGELRSAVYDPATGLFTDVENMAHGRWYPTVTVLGDGRVMTFSGLTETGATNTAVEIYTPGSGWSQQYPASWTPPLYPRQHLLPNGTVFYSGSGTGSRIFDPTTNAWSGVVATTNYTANRTYGTSVLLPLTLASAYKPRVMIMGGNANTDPTKGPTTTNTTEIIDLSAPTLQWQNGPNMSQARIEMNATILPNGKVLATGGSAQDENASTASLKADLFDPLSNTFSPAGVNVYPRLYHSNSLLLPDATVALLGGNPQRGSYEPHIEIYSPAYLFNADGTAAARPTITDVTPSTVAYASAFQVATPDAANIASVVLIRPGAPTHAFDMDQRLVEASFSVGAGVLNVTAPPNGNIAPPGYYMLFILNSAGVPSIARFIKLSVPPPNQAPTATITSPTDNVTINPGGAVSFSGAGSDPDGTISGYSWSFPGGAPSSSAVATPGNVTYSTAGTFVASLSVTDNGGLTSPSATRTITVLNGDFSITATPASRTILKSSGTSYTVTITPGTGFSGTVNLSVSGLPKFTTSKFSPSSIANGGTSTLSIGSNRNVSSGSYTLTITATVSGRSHSATVTLVIQ